MANQIQVLLEALRDSYSLFEQSGKVAHLQDAIQDGQNALSQISLELPNRLTFLIILGGLFAELYDQTHDLNCLTQAIEYSQEAIDLAPKAGCLGTANVQRNAKAWHSDPELTPPKIGGVGSMLQQ